MCENLRRSLLLAYIAWAFAAFLGLHRFYLHRRQQRTFYPSGGFFEFSWLRGWSRMTDFLQELTLKCDFSTYDDSNSSNNILQEASKVFSGYVAACLVLSCIPKGVLSSDESYLRAWWSLLVPLGCGIGINNIGNVGRCKGSLLEALKGAYLASPLFFFLNASNFFWSIILSSTLAWCFFNRKITQRFVLKKEQNFSFSKRFSVIVFILLNFLLVLSSYFYFNYSYLNNFNDEINVQAVIRVLSSFLCWTLYARHFFSLTH